MRALQATTAGRTNIVDIGFDDVLDEHQVVVLPVLG